MGPNAYLYSTDRSPCTGIPSIWHPAAGSHDGSSPPDAESAAIGDTTTDSDAADCDPAGATPTGGAHGATDSTAARRKDAGADHPTACGPATTPSRSSSNSDPCLRHGALPLPSITSISSFVTSISSSTTYCSIDVVISGAGLASCSGGGSLASSW
jgi:hypothetical protein